MSFTISQGSFARGIIPYPCDFIADVVYGILVSALYHSLQHSLTSIMINEVECAKKDRLGRVATTANSHLLVNFAPLFVHISLLAFGQAASISPRLTQNCLKIWLLSVVATRPNYAKVVAP